MSRNLRLLTGLDADVGDKDYHRFMTWQWFRGRTASIPPVFVDGSLALILGLVGAAQLISDRHPFQEFRNRPAPPPNGGPNAPAGSPHLPGFPPAADTLSYILIALCAAPLIFRRRFPLAALLGITLFAAAYLSRGQPPFAIQLIVLVAIYSAVADSSLPRLVSIAVAGATACVLAVAILYGGSPHSSSNWAMDAAWVMAAVFLGDSVRSRRAFETESERGREEEAKRRVSEERVQIARELHDVVGHNISLISVQAGAGEHVLYKDPDQAREAFTNIKSASHETLQELRSMVGVLREPSDTSPAMAPTVGLDALDDLVKAVSDAGQSIEVTINGRKRHLAGVVDLAAYRVLQEALTNTVRHAPRSKVNVVVDYRDDAVALEVTNTAGTEATTREEGGGHGLLGMQERVTAIGGQLYAGPRPDGGFQLRAVLPFPGFAS